MRNPEAINLKQELKQLWLTLELECLSEPPLTESNTANKDLISENNQI